MTNPTPADVERLIANLTRMAGAIRDNASREERPLKRKLMEAKARTFDDAAAALRAMQAEKAGWEELNKGNVRHAVKTGNALIARAEAAEATVATLTAQVEAMRGALEMASHGLQWAQIEFERQGVKGTITLDAAARKVAETLAALTTEKKDG